MTSLFFVEKFFDSIANHPWILFILVLASLGIFFYDHQRYDKRIAGSIFTRPAGWMLIFFLLMVIIFGTVSALRADSSSGSVIQNTELPK